MISSTFFSIFKLILLSKILGPEEFGIYTIILSLYIFIMFFGSLGLNQGSFKYASFSKGRNDSLELKNYISLAINLGGIGILILSVLIFLIINIINLNFLVDKFFYSIVILAFSAFQFNIASTFLRTSQNFIFYAVIIFLKNLLIVLGIYLINYNYEISSIIVIILESLTSLFLSIFVFYIKNVYSSFFKIFFKLESIIKILFAGFTITLSIVVRNLTLNLDKWVLGIMMGEKFVGIYAFSMIFYQFSLVIYNYFSTIFGTKWLAEYGKTNNLKEALVQLYKIVKVIIILSILCLLFVNFFASNFIMLYFEDYTLAVPLLPFIIIGSAASIISYLIEQILIAISKEKSVFYITVLNSVCVVALILIIYFNSLGIIYFAYVFMINRLLSLFLYIYLFKKYKKNIYGF